MMRNSGLELPMDEMWRAEQHRLYDYWVKIRPGDVALPGRQHLNPIEIPDLLPYFFLIDVEKEPLRFRYRVGGTTLETELGHKLTGVCRHDTFAAFSGSLLEQELSSGAAMPGPHNSKVPVLPTLD